MRKGLLWFTSSDYFFGLHLLITSLVYIFWLLLWFTSSDYFLVYIFWLLLWFTSSDYFFGLHLLIRRCKPKTEQTKQWPKEKLQWFTKQYKIWKIIQNTNPTRRTGAPEGLTIPSPLVEAVMLLLLQIKYV
jgi:hypothetical protein